MSQEKPRRGFRVPLPSFKKGRPQRPPKGPRPFVENQEAMRREFKREEMEEDRRRQMRTEADRNEYSPPRPRQRAGSETSEHDYGSIFEGFDQDLSEQSGQLLNEMMLSRKPLPTYDIENRGRPPRASTAFETLRFEPQWPPRGEGRRHSMDISSASFKVALHEFGHQKIEVDNIKKENRTLRTDRDHFRQLCDEKTHEFVHMKSLRNDAVLSAQAAQRRLEPLQSKNEMLEKGRQEYQRANIWLNNELAAMKKALESKDSELNRLKSKNKELDVKLANQKAIQLEALEDLRKKMQSEKDGVDRQLREANRSISSEKGRVNTLKTEKARLEKRVAELDQKLRSANRSLLESETTAKGQEDVIKHLELQSRKDAVATQEISSDVRKAQETAFNMMLEPARWMPKADAEVRRSFDKIRDDLWSWTKACVQKDVPSDVLKSDAALRLLRNISQTDDGAFFFPIDDPKYSTKLPALICMATISSLLYTNIFGSPFFWQQSEASHHADGRVDNLIIDINQIYVDAMKDDEKVANEWRCQMLRTFDPHVMNTDKSTDVESKAEKCRSAAAQRLVEEYLGSDVQLFLDPEALSNNTRIKTLFEIVARAARLSYRLWTQKNRLHIMSFEELDLKGDDGVSRFTSGGELVQHQAYHNVELSKSSSSLDGKPIAIIAHPAIVAYGDSSGEHYSSYKVWKKAEVWMG
ncbi:hypothetical protein P154DRAFT_199739 [Amniculicola lignicola CBS 123094]|uniref:Uncharacterized protein n=1 Tax=Amniculicola lignicola CBS 123094 TaxID=1392246 RepID=A0A6A5WI66_9PLEO|nr:hypothetical protein P154DRAFT_199739 [Amniculicola lignicola CBS 123094]